MLMDFDPAVRAVSSQPFWIRWRDGDDRFRRHAPDFFARMADGAAVIVDVRPGDRIPPRDAETFEVAAAGAGGHHLGECGHVPGERVDVRAASADGLELGLLVWLEAVGPGQQPTGDLAGLRDGRGRTGRGTCLPEWPDVAADGLLAPGPAALLQFGVQLGGVGDAFVPPVSSTRCTRSPARCGNSTASRACPCSPTSQTTRAAGLAGPAGSMTD